MMMLTHVIIYFLLIIECARMHLLLSSFFNKRIFIKNFLIHEIFAKARSKFFLYNMPLWSTADITLNGWKYFLKIISTLLGAQGKSERWITVKVYVWHNWAWLAIIPICLISDIAVNKSFFIFTKKIIFHVIIKIM